MNKKIFLAIFVGLLCFSAFSIARVVRADSPTNTTPITTSASGSCTGNGLEDQNLGALFSVHICSLSDLIFKVLNFFLAFVGLIAVAMIVYGGFRFVTSAGSEEAAESGKKTLQNAIIGLVIIILAYTIVGVVTRTVGGLGSGSSGGTTGTTNTGSPTPTPSAPTPVTPAPPSPCTGPSGSCAVPPANPTPSTPTVPGGCTPNPTIVISPDSTTVNVGDIVNVKIIANPTEDGCPGISLKESVTNAAGMEVYSKNITPTDSISNVADNIPTDSFDLGTASSGTFKITTTYMTGSTTLGAQSVNIRVNKP